jgi:hypothetical protein
VGIKEFFQTQFNKFGWQGKQNKEAESLQSQQLNSVENYNPNERTISTTIDCYVTGEYIGSDGKSIKIRQRYSIPIKYSRSTLNEVMQELRQKIQDEFAKNYPELPITEVFVPLLTPQTAYETISFYRGSKYWKLLLKRNLEPSEAKVDEDVKYKARKIIKRYGQSRQP